MLRVVVLLEVEKDRGRFEHRDWREKAYDGTRQSPKRQHTERN